MSALVGAARPVAIIAKSDERLLPVRAQPQAWFADIWPVPIATFKIASTPWGGSRLANGPMMAGVWFEEPTMRLGTSATPYLALEETVELDVTATIVIQQMPPFDLASGLFRW